MLSAPHPSLAQATYDPDFQSKKPPKGVLNWVGQPAPGQEPPTFEARLYDVLFNSQNPGTQVRGGAGVGLPCRLISRCSRRVGGVVVGAL